MPEVRKGFGLHQSLPITYISGTGTEGTDNTAMTVKSLTLPGKTLTQLGDRLRIRTYVQATVGSNITATLKLNGVSAADATIASTDLSVEEAWFHYIDNTHANILDSNGTPGFSALNVSGFDWSSDQTIAVTQTQVASQHIVVGVIIVDLFPAAVHGSLGFGNK